MTWTKRLVSTMFAVLLACGFFVPYFSASATDETVSVFQQLFDVKPTLNVSDLERYSNRGILSSNFVKQGLPLLALGGAVGAGYYFYGKKGDTKKGKKKDGKKAPHEKALRRFVLGGALNALALFVVLNLVGGVITPTSLNSLAIYVDDQLTFQQGDVVRASFLIQNTGETPATGLVFRNPFPPDLSIDPSTVLFEKNGALPDDYRPLITNADVYVNIGDLQPGESVSLSYDFTIVNDSKENLINTATVTAGDGAIFYSNSSTIRRTPVVPEEPLLVPITE